MSDGRVSPEITGRIVAAFGVPTSIIGPGCAHYAEYRWTDPDGVTGCTKCMTPLDDESEPGLWQYHHTMKINGFYEDALPPENFTSNISGGCAHRGDVVSMTELRQEGLGRWQVVGPLERARTAYEALRGHHRDSTGAASPRGALRSLESLA